MKTAYDFRTTPIVLSAVQETFDEKEIQEDSFLRDILCGNISLEDRLEGLPKFSFDPSNFSDTSSVYDGATIEQLRQALREGRREVEFHITKSLAYKFLDFLKQSLAGILYDKKEEVVLVDEPSLEEKRDELLEGLRLARQQERESRLKLKQARAGLETYLGQMDSVYKQDTAAYPRLAVFAQRLESEIDALKIRLPNELSESAREAYMEQINRGQDYFSKLVNQLGYMQQEIQLVEVSKDRHSKLMIRMDELLDKKDAKLRESLARIKEAEMTRDLSIIVDTAGYLLDLDSDMTEISSLNGEILNIIDAAFDAADTRPPDFKSESAFNYREDHYARKSRELSDMLGRK
ncbi:hypothetical protein ACFL1B_05135 [Nanoarchaeota archaeon]